MDYEFRRDIYGQYKARFSMGHETLVLWLTEELKTDTLLISTLLNEIEKLQNKQCWEYCHSGHEFTLTMNQDGIEVRATLLDESADEAPEELSHYDQESQAGCGLDDFRHLLEAWKQFMHTSNSPGSIY